MLTVSSMNPLGPGPTGSGAPQQPGPQAGGPFGGPAQNPFGGPAPGPGQAPRGANQPGPFGAPGAPSGSSGESLEPVGPPLGILAAAALLAVAGIVVGAVFWGASLSSLGWLLAGPLAIGVLALFTARDTARRTAAVYLRPDWITMAYAVVIVLIAAGVIVGSVGFAMWIGHR